jgi:acylphosphatase
VGEELALRLRVHGRVQGVCYRVWTVEQARELGLAGWVRNRVDGTVEVGVRGPEAAVREMVSRCRRGPPAARVSVVEETADTGLVAEGFGQRATA